VLSDRDVETTAIEEDDSMRSDTQTLSIDADPKLVLAFVGNGENLPRWAVGFANIGAGATATGVTVEPLLVGQTGDESTAIRAVLRVTAGGTTVAVNLDLVGIRRGLVAAGLCIISTGNPPPVSNEYDLAARLGRQMAPFGG
jgi:hypothetical protein